VVKLVLKRHEVQKTDFTRKVCPPGVNSGVVCKSSVVRSDLWITTGTGEKNQESWKTRGKPDPEELFFASQIYLKAARLFAPPHAHS
jgi:hypothetical protein